MRAVLPTSIRRLLWPLGMDLQEKSGVAVLLSAHLTLEVSLGIHTLAFLYSWLRVGFPFAGGIFGIRQWPHRRSGSIMSLRTCFVGCKIAKLPGSCVWHELLLHAQKSRVFYVCYESREGMCADVEFLVLGNGWSWSRDLDHVYVSNASGALLGLPPNPEMLGLPSFLEYFSISLPSPRGSCSPKGFPKYVGVWLAMQDFLEGPDVDTVNTLRKVAFKYEKGSFPHVEGYVRAILPSECRNFSDRLPKLGLTIREVLYAFKCIRVSQKGILTM